jgi:hypothetical protein
MQQTKTAENLGKAIIARQHEYFVEGHLEDLYHISEIAVIISGVSEFLLK